MKFAIKVMLATWMGVVLGAPTAWAAGPWWNYAWKCRRRVTIGQVKPTRLPGDDIAVVTMPTGGRVRPGAVDIRVTTSKMTEVDHRVLMVGPGDQVRVAFAVRPGAKDYFIYFGNPQAEASKVKLEIRRGVLLSTWVYPGGGTGNMTQMTKVFSRAKTFVGRRFVDRIFFAHSPFGPHRRVASTYEGYLVCPRAGKYVFSSSSRNASFLEIDGRLVVSNGGPHEPQRDIRRRGEIELTAGLHRLTFYHASPRGDPVAVAAWRPPGQERVVVIPPGAYAPVIRAAPGVMEEVSKSSVDFVPVHAGETFMRNRYYQRYTFEALAAAGNRSVKEWRWDFGDGQHSTGPKAKHVYLRDGSYTVTLTGEIYTGTLTRTNRIVVSRPWDRVILNRIDKLRDYGRIVGAYDFASLSPPHLAEAVALFDRLGNRDLVIAAGAAAASKKKLPGRLAGRILPIYADALVAKGKASAAAVVLLRGESMTDDPTTGAMLLVRGGRVLLDHLGDPAKAAAAFSLAIKRYGVTTRSSAIRDARIGLGDTWRVRGEREKALTSYRAAGVGRIRKRGGAALARGDFARHVEDYIRRGANVAAAEKLAEWANVFPADKLDGYWSVLRTRQLLAAGKGSQAAREAHILVRVSPESHHAPSLLMLAAMAHRKAGQGDKAAVSLKKIISDYPESSLAARAAGMLDSK